MTRLARADLRFSLFDQGYTQPHQGHETPITLDWLIKECDPAGQGVIDPDTFRSCAIRRGFNPELVQTIFERCDTDRDGALTQADVPNGDGRLDLASTTDNNGRKRAYYWSQAKGEVELELQRRQAQRLEHKLSSAALSEQRLPNGLSIYHLQLPIENLDPQFEGLQILHLSDTHFTHEDSRNLNQLKRLAPHLPQHVDILVTTGDFVDHDLRGLGEVAIGLLKQLTSRASLSLAVLGDHDSKDGRRAEVMRTLCEQAGFSDLTNASLRLVLGGAGFNIHGVDDYNTGKPAVPKIDAAVLREPHLLITHNLDVLTKAYPHCIDLVLSGHLHSGEINLGLFDGIDWLKLQGGYENLNDQKRGLKPLSWRTLSYISPGLATHSHHRFGVERAGATIITLRSWEARFA